jgi:hypothetical protein
MAFLFSLLPLAIQFDGLKSQEKLNDLYIPYQANGRSALLMGQG